MTLLTIVSVTLLYIYYDDTTLYCRFAWASDLWIEIVDTDLWIQILNLNLTCKFGKEKDYLLQ